MKSGKAVTPIVAAKAYLTPKFSLPIGVSLLAVANPMKIAFSENLTSEISSMPRN